MRLTSSLASLCSRLSLLCCLVLACAGLVWHVMHPLLMLSTFSVLELMQSTYYYFCFDLNVCVGLYVGLRGASGRALLPELSAF